MERRAAGLKPPAWAAAAFDPGCDNQQRRRRVTAELRNLRILPAWLLMSR